MKFLFALISFTQCCFSQSNTTFCSQSDLKKFFTTNHIGFRTNPSYNGYTEINNQKIKTRTAYIYNVTKKGKIKDSCLFESVQYDEEGREILRFQFDQNGLETFYSKHTYEYMANELVITTYDSTRGYFKYYYNPNNQLIKDESYEDSTFSKMTYQFEYFYNNNGIYKCISKLNQNITDTSHWVYDSISKITRVYYADRLNYSIHYIEDSCMIEYRYTNKSIGDTRYYFDENNYLIKQEVTSLWKNKTTIFQTTYVRDNYGRLIEIYTNTKNNLPDHRKYKYNEVGLLSKEELIDYRQVIKYNYSYY